MVAIPFSRESSWSRGQTWVSHIVCRFFTIWATRYMYIYIYIYMKWSEVAQSGPTFWDPMDCSLLRSSIPGILQARTLQGVAISFSNAGKWKVKVKLLSRVQLSRPHGLQPTRLLHPWEFPGKSTGVGCHRLFRYMYIYIHIHIHTYT